MRSQTGTIALWGDGVLALASLNLSGVTSIAQRNCSARTNIRKALGAATPTA